MVIAPFETSEPRLVSHQWHLVVNCGATNYLLIYAKRMMSLEIEVGREKLPMQQQQLA